VWAAYFPKSRLHVLFSHTRLTLSFIRRKFLRFDQFPADNKPVENPQTGPVLFTGSTHQRLPPD
jgi:hypothetical protein